MTPAEKAIARVMADIWDAYPTAHIVKSNIDHLMDCACIAQQLAKALAVALEAIEQVRCFSTADETLLWKAKNEINEIFTKET